CHGRGVGKKHAWMVKQICGHVKVVLVELLRGSELLLLLLLRASSDAPFLQLRGELCAQHGLCPFVLGSLGSLAGRKIL
ncbi:UNVERIFIED_CONTAM: hypothetical protein NY603_35810, partial [Bacteroidetes bacterium 56_B9]